MRQHRTLPCGSSSVAGQRLFFKVPVLVNRSSCSDCHVPIFYVGSHWHGFIMAHLSPRPCWRVDCCGNLPCSTDSTVQNRMVQQFDPTISFNLWDPGGVPQFTSESTESSNGGSSSHRSSVWKSDAINTGQHSHLSFPVPKMAELGGSPFSPHGSHWNSQSNGPNFVAQITSRLRAPGFPAGRPHHGLVKTSQGDFETCLKWFSVIICIIYYDCYGISWFMSVHHICIIYIYICIYIYIHRLLETSPSFGSSWRKRPFSPRHLHRHVAPRHLHGHLPRLSVWWGRSTALYCAFAFSWACA